MTETLTQEQRDRRWRQAHTAIGNALAASWTEWRRTGRRPDFAKAADHAMDGLGDLAAEIMVDGTMMRALTVKDGVVTVELAEARWYLQLYVASMRAVLDDVGAENYAEISYETAPSVSLDLRDGTNPSDDYTLTLQRRTKPTPHEFRLKAEENLATVMHVLSGWLEQFDDGEDVTTDDLTRSLARAGHPVPGYEHQESQA